MNIVAKNNPHLNMLSKLLCTPILGRIKIQVNVLVLVLSEVKNKSHYITHCIMALTFPFKKCLASLD